MCCIDQSCWKVYCFLMVSCVACSDKVVHEDLQEEITQLRNEKGSLQMALSESEITLADTREELVEMKKKVRDICCVMIGD